MIMPTTSRKSSNRRSLLTGSPQNCMWTMAAAIQASAYKEPGMVINDHDAVDPPALSVLCDVREITGIRLPHLSERILLKSLPVTHVRVSCGFEVMFLHKSLDGTDTDRCRDKGLFYEVPVDLRGIQAGKGFLDPEDLLDSRIRQYTGGAFVRTLLRHEGTIPRSCGHIKTHQGSKTRWQ